MNVFDCHTYRVTIKSHMGLTRQGDGLNWLSLLAVSVVMKMVEEDVKPLADEIPYKYLARAKDEIAKQLALAKRTKDKDLIRKWEEFEQNPEKRAYDLWALEHPGAHAFVKNKPALDLLDTLRTLDLSINQFDVGFTEQEKSYLEKRKDEYSKEYEFNQSSDAIMLRATLIVELHLLQQTILLQYDPDGKSKVLDRVSELIKQLQTLHDSLKALRKQRIPNPPAPKAVKEDKKSADINPFNEVTKRYEVNEDRAEELQSKMDSETEAFLQRRKDRLARTEVNGEDDGGLGEEENDLFDE